MAIGDPYADSTAVGERFGDVDDLALLIDLAVPASQAVERFCGRQFNKATTATARRFRPVDWRRLPVDDFHTVTGLVVTVGGTVWDAANYDPRPWNGVVAGQPGWPFYDLIAVNRCWPSSDATAVGVEAQWGWPSVPAGIVEATLDVIAAMRAAGVGGSTSAITSESVAGYSVSYAVPSFGASTTDVPPELAKAAPYRRKRFGVA